ncbi:MAG: response regulator, partial [Rubrivivax sp.]|nr:response regulator [Rubrivivax sp.]
RQPVAAVPVAAPAPPLAGTIFLPARAPEATPSATDGVDFVFSLSDLDDDELASTPPSTPLWLPASTLVERVPELPSAADLQMPSRAVGVATAPTALMPGVMPGVVPSLVPDLAPDAMTTTEVDFDLDLGEFNIATGVMTAVKPTPPAAPSPSVYADLDLPLDAGPDSVQAELASMSDTLVQALPEAAVEGLEIDLDELEGVDFGNGVVSGLAPLPEPAVSDLALEPEPAAQPDVAAGTVAQPRADSAVHAEADSALQPEADAALQPEADLALQPDAGAALQPGADEQIKQIGPLRISIPLFNIYLNEADELSRRLVTELAEWAVEADRHPVSDTAVALAHSLAGSSATVGYADLSALARALEHALMRSHTAGHGREGEAVLFTAAADEIRRLLHQFAAGFLRLVDPQLMEQLAANERLPVDDGDAQDSDAQDGIPAVNTLAAAMFTTITLPATNTGTFKAFVPDDDIDAVDAIDAELFPIFEEEADELLPQLHNRLREWHDHPGNPGAPAACMRTLHTFKGGARLAGAMRLGEMAHRLETGIEQLSAQDNVQAAQVEPLMVRADAMLAAFETLRRAGPALPAPEAAPKPASASASAPSLVPQPAVPAAAGPAALAAPITADAAEAADTADTADGALPPHERTAPMDAEAFLSAMAAMSPPAVLLQAVLQPLQPLQPLQATDVDVDVDAAAEPAAAASALRPAKPQEVIDWSRFVHSGVSPEAAAAADKPVIASTAAVRVRAGLLDRLVNNAGEVSITRSRIDSNVQTLQGSLGELTDSLERMRRQLRDIELQAETQISSRLEAAKSVGQAFDPLEMDRFTRFQELTRFMAESVNDVATLQRSLQRTLQSAEDELAAQARLTRELQDDLLRTRMVEFESLADRLYRTVRQAAKETAKQVRLDIVGGSIEIDRGVLERMAGSFEHLLRNCVAHGVEIPAERERAGKDQHGSITVTVAQAGNEVAVEVADDGAGLDLARIRQRGIERGLLAPDNVADAAALSQLIFAPGFSTAETVTELAGRGVGLDVVRSEVNAMGGRIETQSQPGRGTRFRLLLPLTTAVTQVVMLRCGPTQVAVPSPLIEVVKRVPTAEVEAAYASGQLQHAGEAIPFFWLAALLQAGTRGPDSGRMQSLVIVRSAAQRVAVHVDEVQGNQEVVVKNVGPQLARLPGLAGVTLLPSGAVALIYNPVALATVYADAARLQAASGRAGSGGAAVVAAPTQAEQAPLILVVDDSLTVRRVTQRLLVREGYRVVTAKDGLDALERLAEERPVVLLSDIEMPRMDGFDLVRNVRADPKLQGLPVIMITSRIAQKHRDYATELGVDHYLGKPYSEEELLALVARYVLTYAVD